MKLSDREWKPFILEKIFRIESGKRLECYNMTDGRRPFIGATDNGNGITNYVENENESLDKNVLGVNYNGNGMAISFYHPYKCIFSDDVKRFHLRETEDNKYVFLFFKTIILQQKSKYNYGYKFNGNRMKRQIILLPVNDSDDPDYMFMQQYMLEIEKEKIDLYTKYLYMQREKRDCRQIENISQKQWGAFKISSVLGKSKNAKPYHKEYLKIDSENTDALPYITRTSINNGLYSMIDNNEAYLVNPKNSISLGAENATYFYQPYKYITGNKMYYYKNEKISKYSALFIVCCLNKSISDSGFGYGLGLTGNRSDIRKVLLPIKENKEPDFEYMEQYIKNLLFEKYNNYLAYIEK